MSVVSVIPQAPGVSFYLFNYFIYFSQDWIHLPTGLPKWPPHFSLIIPPVLVVRSCACFSAVENWQPGSQTLASEMSCLVWVVFWKKKWLFFPVFKNWEIWHINTGFQFFFKNTKRRLNVLFSLVWSPPGLLSVVVFSALAPVGTEFAISALGLPVFFLHRDQITIPLFSFLYHW